MHTTLGLTEHQITPYIRFAIPYPRMEGIPPDARTWWSAAAVVIVAVRSQLLFSRRSLCPSCIFCARVLFIQVTALLFFLFLPARFSHSPDSYMEGLTGTKSR